MKTLVTSAKPYDRRFLDEANASAGHTLTYVEARLDAGTASLADGYDAVCAFVNDRLDERTLTRLADGGVRVVALRCAGFNNVDLETAKRLGVAIVRVPAYSPHAIAEHTLALILSLNRRIHRAYSRVRDGNFSLDGLLGFDLCGKTVGVVGTGKIGAIFARIATGLGCRVVAHDQRENAECVALGVRYLGLRELLGESDIVSLHCPLTPETRHLIDADAVDQMKPGAMLVNTSRGAIVDTSAVIDGLKSGRLGSLALDVYEEEGDYFFEDLSNQVLSDDTLARLLTFPNALVTSHQAFFTREAMTAIAETTIGNLSQVERGEACPNAVA